MTTTLYRAFDTQGRLLYVGISDTPFLRLGAHADRARWTQYVTRLELERFSSRDEAEDAELEAIRTEDPVFNINGRPLDRYMQHAVAYPAGDPDEVDPHALARGLLEEAERLGRIPSDDHRVDPDDSVQRAAS